MRKPVGFSFKREAIWMLILGGLGLIAIIVNLVLPALMRRF
jgi:hypothetical protein